VRVRPSLAKSLQVRAARRKMLRPDLPGDRSAMSIRPRSLPFVACALALLALPLGARAQQLESEDQKTIYALGLAVARNLKAFDLTPDEIKILEAGLTAGLSGATPAVDLNAYQAKLDPLAQARIGVRAKRERTAAAEFVKKAAGQSGAKTLPSGLVYRELKAGTGAAPTPKDKVKINYTGKLRDGQVFDSSVERGKPADFPLGRMIPCWLEGLQLMKTGGKAELTCPPDLAYGDTGIPPGSGERVPPGAALQFEVELLAVEKGAGVSEKLPENPLTK
jgi:FKBP-type peptidyl-prolyl cis-trans isomerase FkpA